MGCKSRIEAYFDTMQSGDVFLAGKVYCDAFKDISETAYFKTLERMALNKEIIRASKGIYVRIDCPDVREAVLNYYFGENNDNGMLIGYKLYNKYSISNVVSDTTEMYSNIITQDRMKLEHIIITKVNIELSYNNTRIIEALEILQNYESIQNLSKTNFNRYICSIAANYDDEITTTVLRAMKYKKSTIAFLKKILDTYKIENSLATFLSAASRYKIPTFAVVSLKSKK